MNCLARVTSFRGWAEHLSIHFSSRILFYQHPPGSLHSLFVGDNESSKIFEEYFLLNEPWFLSVVNLLSNGEDRVTLGGEIATELINETFFRTFHIFFFRLPKLLLPWVWILWVQPQVLWFVWGSLGSFMKPTHGVLCAPRQPWNLKPQSLTTTFKILRKSEENLWLESQLTEPSLFVERFCEILVAEGSDHSFHFPVHIHLYAQIKQIAHSVYLHGTCQLICCFLLCFEGLQGLLFDL